MDVWLPIWDYGRGVSLPLYHPYRLLINVVGFSFLFVVPVTYTAIYWFRKRHDHTVQGTLYRIVNIIPGFKTDFETKNSGITQAERRKRKKQNLVATGINLAVWVLEIFASVVLFLPMVRLLHTRDTQNRSQKWRYKLCII